MHSLAWNKNLDVNAADKNFTVNFAVAEFLPVLDLDGWNNPKLHFSSLDNSTSASTFYSLFLPTFLSSCLPLAPSLLVSLSFPSLPHSFIPSSIIKYVFYVCMQNTVFTSRSYMYIFLLLLYYYINRNGHKRINAVSLRRFSLLIIDKKCYSKFNIKVD